MRRRFRFVTVFAVAASFLLAALPALPAHARQPVAPAVSRPAATVYGTAADAVVLEAVLSKPRHGWFVELEAPPLVRSGLSVQSAREAVDRQQTTFFETARRRGLDIAERQRYQHLWNGVAVAAAADDVPALAQLPGVKAVYPIVEVALPDLMPAVPAMFSAVEQTGADRVHSELGFTGAGLLVGVIDSGIDYTHPDLGGGFGTGYKVVRGWDFVGDAFNADASSPAYNPVPQPDPDPLDCDGHGTHVAGIIAADGKVTGVAPGASLAAYRVFGCEGSTTSDVILAAMEQAYADGVDIINMSLGGAFLWPQYPTAVAANNLVSEGIVVVAAMGNAQEYGIFSGGAPGVGADVIAVASFENTLLHQPYVTVSDGETDYDAPYNAGTGAPVPPDEGELELVVAEPLLACEDAASAFLDNADDVAGKAVLIQRGVCSFHLKALAAQDAGAAAVVLYNNTTGVVTPIVAGETPITIPVIMLTQTDGDMIRYMVETAGDGAAVTLTWRDDLHVSPNPDANLVSAFSSYGLAPDLSLKPDIGAPGGGIYSTLPGEAYGSMNGTSMAAPHVAGAVALLLEARPELKNDVRQVRDLLQNTAVPQVWWGNPALGFLESVHLQGAGMLQIDAAIEATTAVSPGKLSLGDGSNTKQRTLTLTNAGDEPVTYALSMEEGIGTWGVHWIEGFFDFFVGAVTAGFLDEDGVPITTITVPAHGTATVTAVITPMAFDTDVYGGYIVFDPLEGSTTTLRVPFAGMAGSYQSVTVMHQWVPGFYPWLTYPDGTTLRKIDADGDRTFTLADGDEPYLVMHFDYGPSLVEIQVLDDEGEYVGTYLAQPYLPRNPTWDGYYTVSWDGTIEVDGRREAVDDGDYRLLLRVLKPLGNPEIPVHWEQFISPSFSIARGAAAVTDVLPEGVHYLQPGDELNVSFQALTDVESAQFFVVPDDPDGPSFGPVAMAEIEDTGVFSGSWTVPDGTEGMYGIRIEIEGPDDLATTVHANAVLLISIPPGKPVILTPAHQSVVKQTSVTVTGTAEPEAYVEVTAQSAGGDSVLGLARADTDGLWEAELQLSDGYWTLLATVYGHDGTSRVESDAVFVRVNTAPSPPPPPPPPTADEPEPQEDQDPPAPAAGPTFTDIDGHWAMEDIMFLADLGIVSGIGGGLFDPEGTVTRAQFARMLVLAVGWEPMADPVLPFTDAADIPDWAAGYVATAHARGVILGKPDGRFAPHEFITREEMAVMIARAIGLTESGDTGFTDNEFISDWARGPTRWLGEEGIISGMGDGTFAPKDYLTRAQGARVLAQFIRRIGPLL